MDYESLTKEELIEELKAMRREIRLSSLRRRVTPHFLFHSLSTAMGLVMSSPKSAVLFLRYMARMYRYLLNYGEEYHVPVEQELEMVTQYFELMSIRFPDSIRLTVTPEVYALKGNPLPPLSLQGIMENAIKHNAHSKDNVLQIKLKVMTQANAKGGIDRFLCMENNLIPLPIPPAPGGKGLTYVIETMRLIFNCDTVVDYDGKTFRVMIPLVTHSAKQESALKAFEHDSLSFLMKPMGDDELRAAIRSTQEPMITEERREELLRLLANNVHYRERFLVSTFNGETIIHVSEIRYFVSEQKNSYVKLHDGTSYVVDFTLTELAEQLNPQQFMRVNRKYIVPISGVDRLEQGTNGKELLILNGDNPPEIVISRDNKHNVHKWLK